MSKDFFGYDRNVKSKELLSSDFAVVSAEGGQLSLAQQIQAQYQHRVEPRYEAGSSDLYWVNGQPTGNMTINRLIGRSGFLDNLSENSCGEVQSLDLSLSEDVCDISVSGNKTLFFSGAMLQSVNFSIAVNALDIKENLSYVVASMNVS